jgi:hypothetical protein
LPGIVADVNLDGHMRLLNTLLTSPGYAELWNALGFELLSFEQLGWDRTLPDSSVWLLCQASELLVLTGNRNQDGPDSLEATIRGSGAENYLPVFTISNPRRFLDSREYATKVVERLLDYLYVLDRIRGAGRLYLP